MTPNTTTTRSTCTTQTPDVEQLLRDAAFVLRMTRRVKNEILRDAAEPNYQARQLADLTPAALGV
jgi:hypothetical protein